MKTLLVCLALCASVLQADPCYTQNPFGRTWVCSGVEPKVTPDKPVTPPAPAPFVPVFEQGVTVNITVNGVVISSPVNEWYYATKETADAICKRLLCLTVFDMAAFEGGPYQVAAKQRMLLWTDGLIENAGIMAAFYTRNPESVADRLVNAQIDRDRSDAKARAAMENGFAKARMALEAQKQQ